jgi:hypothetical protein
MYRVRRFAPSPVRFLDKFTNGERFFSAYGKNLLPCGKFNAIYAKRIQKYAIFTMRELAKDKLFILCWKMQVHVNGTWKKRKKYKCTQRTR